MACKDRSDSKRMWKGCEYIFDSWFDKIKESVNGSPPWNICLEVNWIDIRRTHFDSNKRTKQWKWC